MCVGVRLMMPNGSQIDIKGEGMIQFHEAYIARVGTHECVANAVSMTVAT